MSLTRIVGGNHPTRRREKSTHDEIDHVGAWGSLEILFRLCNPEPSVYVKAPRVSFPLCMMFKNNFVTIDNPNFIPAEDLPHGKKFTIVDESKPLDDLGLGELEVNDIYLPGASVRTIRGRFHHNVRFFNQHGVGSDLIGSCLFYEGTIKTTTRGNLKGVVLKKGLQSLKYDPYNDYTHWCAAETPFDIVHLSIVPEFLFEMLPDDERWSYTLKERILNKERILGEQPAVITSLQHKAIQQLLNCPIDGKLGIMLMEACIVQIMALQMNAQFKDNYETKPNKISSRDNDFIHGVKEYLTVAYLEEHSLASLARHFATNTNKLMTLFRKTFDCSIFDYIHELKMDHAKRLLQEEGRYVSEVAREVGYKNPHHFAAAFKRRHGVIPSNLRYQFQSLS